MCWSFIKGFLEYRVVVVTVDLKELESSVIQSAENLRFGKEPLFVRLSLNACGPVRRLHVAWIKRLRLEGRAGDHAVLGHFVAEAGQMRRRPSCWTTVISEKKAR